MFVLYVVHFYPWIQNAVRPERLSKYIFLFGFLLALVVMVNYFAIIY